jgi:hypothetical protein
VKKGKANSTKLSNLILPLILYTTGRIDLGQYLVSFSMKWGFYYIDILVGSLTSVHIWKGIFINKRPRTSVIIHFETALLLNQTSSSPETWNEEQFGETHFIKYKMVRRIEHQTKLTRVSAGPMST